MGLPEKFTGFAVQCRRLMESAARRVIPRARRVASGPGRGLRFDGGRATDLFLSGKYERPVQEIIWSLANPGDVFYDIGANVGFFSVLAGRLIGPKGSVYAFEPVPKNASRVEKNARLNGLENIRVLQVAVSNRNGRSDLLLARYAGGAVLKSAGVPPDPAGSLIVETSTLDDLVERQGLRPPQIVKIDVEGAELDVLNGMADVLRTASPKIILEVDDAALERCEEKLSACRLFLEDLQYRIEILPNSYRDGKWFVRHLLAQR